MKGGVRLSEAAQKRYPGFKYPQWLPFTVREGENGTLLWPPPRQVDGYDEMALSVEADGYQPQASSWLKRKTLPATLELAMVVDPGVTGQVLQPDGRPAKGARLTIAMRGIPIAITNGLLPGENDPLPENAIDRWRQSTIAKADAEGNFRLPTETDPGAAVVIVHPKGTVAMSFADFRNQPRIMLKRWGRVVGRVQRADRAGADERVFALTDYRYEYDGFPGLIRASAATRADAQGNFVLDHLLPGRVEVSEGIELPYDGRTLGTAPLYFDRQSVEVGSDGEPTVVLFGGQGRTVTGRLTGRDSWEGVTLKYLPKFPQVGGFHGNVWHAYVRWERSLVGPLYFRSELKPNADGTFEISHVLPGDYRLFVTATGAKHYAGGTEFSVEREQPGEAPLRSTSARSRSIPRQCQSSN